MEENNPYDYKLILRGNEEEKKRLEEIIENLPFCIFIEKRDFLARILKREPELIIWIEKRGMGEYVNFFPSHCSVSVSLDGSKIEEKHNYAFELRGNGLNYIVWYNS